MRRAVPLWLGGAIVVFTVAVAAIVALFVSVSRTTGQAPPVAVTEVRKPVPPPPVPIAPPTPSPRPPPRVAVAATSTPTPTAPATATAKPTATPSPEPTPTASPTPTPAPRTTPAPTPTPSPPPTPATWIEGIAVGETAEQALANLNAGVFDDPAPAPPGRAIFAIYRAHGWAFGTRLTRTWIRNGAVVEEDFVDIREPSEQHRLSIGAIDGVAGGLWRLEVRAGDTVLADVSTPVDDRTPTVTHLAFAVGVNADNQAINPSHEFAAGTESLVAVFRAFNIAPATPLRLMWLVNGAAVDEQSMPWPSEWPSGAGSAHTVTSQAPAGGGGLDAGDYRFKVFMDGREILNDIVRVG